MRVDGDDDDELITGLMAAAREYLKGAGIEEPQDPSLGALYRTALHSITLHYYDHRDSVGDEASFPAGTRPIINQLKHLGDSPL